MNTDEMLGTIGLVAVFYLLITSIPTARRVRNLRRRIRVERTRSYWGEARVLMYKLAREGKISVHSQTFQSFVEMQTFVLRRPEEYEKISEVLFRQFMHPSTSPGVPVWRQEVPAWPAEMQEVTRNMAHGTQQLLWSRGRGRMIMFVGLKLLPWMARHLGGRMYARASRYIQVQGAKVRSVARDRELFAAMRGMEHVGP
jgi:hypothetical protein